MMWTPYLTCVALLAITVNSALNNFTNLLPVLAPGYDITELGNIVPSTNVSLDYGLDTPVDPRSSVNIELQANQPAVLLEAIGQVLRVACTGNSVTVTFDSVDAFKRSISEWPRNGKFYLITNHLEDCNAGGERGIYQVTSLDWDNDTVTVTAQTQKSTIASMTTSMAVTFSHVQNSMQNNSGNITFDEPGINVASNFTLPTDMEIFSEPPNFVAKANEGYLSDAAIIRGYFDYDVPSSQVQNLWFDIDAAFFGDLSLTFNLTKPLNNNNYVFSPGIFSPSAINVPSAFSLRPALRWAIGADVGAVGAVLHNSNFTITIPDGHAHVDFLNNTLSHAVGWGPRFTTSFNTNEAATGHVSPYVDFTVELALDVLDGSFNTTGGVAARPQLINDLNVAQTHTRVRRADRMIWPRNVTCNNGFELRSDVNFTVTAYVKDSWEKTLYNTEIPVADDCFPFNQRQ
ncbi:hypothetical protein M426DRAFT_6799 [Hypoxylon sp. CI-4A]|nr:hypothetical protein M426DRAFT_6799 [Hypoxylon sp. CI-4A]